MLMINIGNIVMAKIVIPVFTVYLSKANEVQCFAAPSPVSRRKMTYSISLTFPLLTNKCSIKDCYDNTFCSLRNYILVIIGRNKLTLNLVLRISPKIKPKPEPPTRVVLIVDVLGKKKKKNNYVIRDLKINDAQRPRRMKRIRDSKLDGITAP